MFVHIIFSSVSIAEWPPFGKELPTRLTICYLVFCLFVILVICRFGFEGGIWVLIAPVPGHCIILHVDSQRDSQREKSRGPDRDGFTVRHKQAAS